MVIHVFLLFVVRADGCKTGRFPLGKSPAQSELFFNGGKVSRQMAQLFSDRLADLLCRLLATAAELQEIPMRLGAVSAWLAAVGRIMQLVQELFRVFPGFVEQRCVLRVANIGGCAGSVHDHGTAVAAVSMAVVVTVLLFLCFG